MYNTALIIESSIVQKNCTKTARTAFFSVALTHVDYNCTVRFKNRTFQGLIELSII